MLSAKHVPLTAAYDQNAISTVVYSHILATVTGYTCAITPGYNNPTATVRLMQLFPDAYVITLAGQDPDSNI